MKKTIQTDSSQIKKVLKNWIDNEANNARIQEIFNQEFEEIQYDNKTGLFEISEDEANRLGIS